MSLQPGEIPSIPQETRRIVRPLGWFARHGPCLDAYYLPRTAAPSSPKRYRW
jgi:hypothetical protein